ncbi:hypothetical protein RJ640_027289 [Escallonia rubra]|uniref:Digalactosyldiacylglycerol synthase 2, chloroplastic n=1 Tax=Escallonia rubra TaxID=112253 RepID=A0AA88RES2_9ASTE|nr:hypothetical protein RJ640_027289 [Escallonia rubra]
MDEKQHIAIFTTASLPWMTGTAVNPLFRASYLAKDGEKKVTLVIPWLSMKDQEYLYPNKITFNLPSEQEKYVREWLEERTGFKSSFNIRFYPGRFEEVLLKGMLTQTRDITEIIPDEEADIVVLEEPEHLTCLAGESAAVKFVPKLRQWRSRSSGSVIRLSAATQELPRSVICNVHGVNPKFLEIGMTKKDQQQLGNKVFPKDAYYIGKMVWSKGYKELLKLLRDHQKELKELEVDLFGSGEDSGQIQEAAKKLELVVRVHPGRDHADPLFHDYKVFLNPSTTDVVCTTTAEALAMGKIVVCAEHPSNDFFKQFPNCRTFEDGDGFVKATCKALTDEPALLTDAQRYELSWEAATERFLRAAELDNVPARRLKKTPSKLFGSTSLNLSRNLEDASALVHFVGTALLSSQPDEEQCKELGLDVPARKHGFTFGKRGTSG